jgi:hypothetical protein
LFNCYFYIHFVLSYCFLYIIRKFLSVINKFKDRAKFGKQKYGTDLDRNDLSVKDWIQHAQEELMDGILYLEKLKHTLK